jgi:ADP-L-glycero-D-manno-heptose 6-epimerase
MWRQKVDPFYFARGQRFPDRIVGKQYQFFTEADISLSREFLEYEPKFSLEDGIKAYIPEIKRIFEKEL